VGDKMIHFVHFVFSQNKGGGQNDLFFYFVHFVFFQKKGGGQNDLFCSFCSEKRQNEQNEQNESFCPPTFILRKDKISDLMVYFLGFYTFKKK